MKLKIRFIINPVSGIGRKNKLPKMIEQYLDHSKFEYDIVYTEFRKHAVTMAEQSIKENVDIVCAVGGDGSVNEVGSALIGSDVRMAIIPAGSGNGLARHLKIPINIKQAILSINDNSVQIIDTGEINDKTFLGVAGFGFDALIAKRFDEYHARGIFSYIKLVLKEYIAYKPVSVVVNNECFDKLVLCSLANGSQFGNGFCISPKSKVEDGELEFFALKKFPWYVSPVLLWRFFMCTAHKSKYTEIRKGASFLIKVKSNLAHIDGEPVEVKEVLNVKVNPKSLKVLVGKKYK